MSVHMPSSLYVERSRSSVVVASMKRINIFVEIDVDIKLAIACSNAAKTESSLKLLVNSDLFWYSLVCCRS